MTCEIIAFVDIGGDSTQRVRRFYCPCNVTMAVIIAGLSMPGLQDG